MRANSPRAFTCRLVCLFRPSGSWPAQARLAGSPSLSGRSSKEMGQLPGTSLPSSAFAEAVEASVLRADDDAAGGDGGGGGKRGAGFEIPELLAGPEIDHVEVAVVGTYVDAIAGDGWGRFHAGARGERPDRLAGMEIQAVDLLFAAGHPPAVSRDCRRRVERERAGVAPDDALAPHVGADHLIGERAVVSPIADAHGGCAGIAAGGKLHRLLAVGDAYAVKDLVATGHPRDAGGNGGRGVHVAGGFGFPQQLAVALGERVEVAVVRADQDPVAHNHGRRFDLRFGGEGP